MNNRSLELCISNKINTIDEFSKIVGIPVDEAAALINKDDTVKVSEESISKCLKFFNCNYDYFFCLVE